MREFKEETNTALAEGRTALFVLFDFEFVPIRAHSGTDVVVWKDLEWDGVGDALLTNSMCKPMSIGRESDSRGRMSASLPAGGRMAEILDRGYYRNRAMQWSMCAVTPAGEVLEVVLENAGSIVEYTAKDDVVTFYAEDDRLDSQRELDTRHKTKVTAIRKRFKEDLVQTVPSALPGWANTLVGVLAGNVLSIAGDMLKLALATRSRRSFIQRWRARQRLFVFYVRKPGPRSEVPRSAREWDELLSRCLENRRDELASLMRRVLAGLEPRPQPGDPDERLDRWEHECFRRWSELVENLPPDAEARFPCGYYSFAYEVVGATGNAALQELPDVLRASVVRHSGWQDFPMLSVVRR